MTRHSRNAAFYGALVAGLAVTAVCAWLEPRMAITGGANVFFLTYLGLSARKLRHLTAAYLKKYAAGADMPAWVIFAATFGAALVAITSLFLFINGQQSASPRDLALSLASVGLGWATIHTMAAFHYAHVYWAPDRKAGSEGKASWHGGLEFPQTPEPCGYDFLYFAFVTGMTAQTSDVAITNSTMRKLNLLHGIISFFFNTVLVAAAVNLVVSLGN